MAKKEQLEEKKNVFADLVERNVNEHKEKRSNGSKELDYLSWTWAWSELKKVYPGANYTIYHNEQMQPYFEDPDFGLMCYTTVTIEGQTHEMWLPVMNGANKAMKRSPYKYQAWNAKQKKYEEKYVEAATMFDINKTIMRCLVKNIAMFGLGLYIYAGEDLPENVTDEQQQTQKPAATTPPTPSNDLYAATYEAAMKLIKPEIMEAKNVDQLREIWDNNPTLHKYQPFSNLVTTRKNELDAPN